MSSAFTTLWTKDRCKILSSNHLEGTPISVLFGGPHTSEPGFRRAGVIPGDFIYPVRVDKGILYLIARVRVKEIISIEDYIKVFPEEFIGCEKSPWPSLVFDSYIKLHPEKRFLAPTCTEEAVLVEESTPMRLDVAVPAEMLERLRFRSQKRERGLKHIKDGLLKSVISLQGIYRLSAASARDFEKLLIDEGIIS